VAGSCEYGEGPAGSSTTVLVNQSVSRSVRQPVGQ
jgi:hypothetical protein